MTDTSNVDDAEIARQEAFNNKMIEAAEKVMNANLPKLAQEVESRVLGVVNEMMTSKIEELKEMLEGSRAKSKERRCTYKDFMACNPFSYNGEVDPVKCQRWIANIEAVFVRSRCEKEDQVMFATGQLQQQAKDWWDTQSKEIGEVRLQTLTWQEFKELFLKYHCPQSAIDRIQDEFLHLRQQNESIDEITNIFFDKLKFCDDFVKSERMKINRYYGMLKAEYREFITPSKCETLSELINLARDREIELKRQVERGEKRVAEKPSTTNPSKKPKQHDTRTKGGSKGSIPPCKTCGKLHTGECLMGKKGCYNCGQEGHPYFKCPSPVRTCFNCFTPGHVKADCPKLKQQGQKDEKKNENQKARGRMFQITTEEAKASPNVVSGIFLINQIPVNVLFDSGASKSFVSDELMCYPSFRKERMSVPLEVEVADSKSYLLCEICKNCKITIENEEFEIDLIPMTLGEFKVVVGMDWLSRYHAEIRCEAKVIHVFSPSGARISICGERKLETKLCTIVEAVKHARNEGKVYLVYVVDTRQKVPEIGEVEVVNEYADVFPDELPGLPPEREVEFRIELNPGAKPVAKAPYRLAPTEMRELMTQIQELLDKGFVRPSVSPWGAPMIFLTNCKEQVGFQKSICVRGITNFGYGKKMLQKLRSGPDMGITSF
ncbi:uncharacterized protein LOC110900688 [Helianthus annuus]|uniref:uncharacterized protein LOC110900688 n=1 Tax=Helianthus annuus TaxID=4232 RepID=UPI000B902F22|nr:uncharacterized protein LOC110900688 [Helianthus annuus]